MSNKQKLELTWIGKENRPKLEPRILIETPDKSYHAKHKVTENDIFDNILIHGDNLLALKALEQEYTGKVKCVCIDPPYNTGNAFKHYDDGLEHSVWLSLIRDRIELIHRLLSEDGSLWISIDDYEVHYLKVMCDEIFGRQNFVSTIIWQQRTTRENRKTFSNNHEYILLYAKDYAKFVAYRNTLDLTEDVKRRYKNPDNDPKGPWQSVSANAQAGHGTATQFYTLIAPNGKQHNLPLGRCWLYTKDRMDEKISNKEIWFGKNGNGAPRIKKYLSEATTGLTPETLWLAKDVGTNDHAKKNLISMFKLKDIFDTPKPESLIHQVLCIATNPGDLVLDSFLGSATTAAVAHKMGRRWIGIELGEHCNTYCIPRLKNVIDGEDQGGITASVNWKGGGGFRFYELGPTLIKDDEWGNPVINPEFKPEMLAEAMCKLEGFTYKPSDEYFWIHGYSTESDYIFITTQFMSRDMLTKISDEVGPERSLLICCSAFNCNPAEFPNLTIKKIPKAVLKKCEWDHDDYSLEIKNLTEESKSPDLSSDEKVEKKTKKFGKGKDDSPELPGFDLGAVK